MNRQQVLKKLAELKPGLAECFEVTRLALFGYMARGDARADSDVDVVVAFDGKSLIQQHRMVKETGKAQIEVDEPYDLLKKTEVP